MLMGLAFFVGAMFGALLMVCVRGFEYRVVWPGASLDVPPSTLRAIDAVLGITPGDEEPETLARLEAMLEAHGGSRRVREVAAAHRDAILAQRRLGHDLEKLQGEERFAAAAFGNARGCEQRACAHMLVVVEREKAGVR